VAKLGRSSSGTGSWLAATFSFGGIGTQRDAKVPSTGPEMMRTGMPMRMPNARVMPRFAPSVSMAMSGPGCGGTKQ